jgi:DNA-binding transcriptional ArsR family regulator
MHSKEPKAGRPKVAALDACHFERDKTGRWLREGDDQNVVGRAAMAHLHVASVHPFRDGNGRVPEAQGGSYQPDRDASGWVAFCVEAHLVQPRRRLAQLEAAVARWGHLESLVAEPGRPERLVIALEQSLIGGTERGSYGKEAVVSRATASADFRRLLDAGLVEQRGRGKSTGYRASEELRSRVSRALESD